MATEGKPPFRVGDAVRLIDHSKVGQIHEVSGGEAKVLFDESNDMVVVPIVDIELLPNRFQGVLIKYSRNGRLVRNWKTRVFEVWSDTLTYREENSVKVLGGMVLTVQSELISDSTITARKDRFRGDPPHEYFCGIYDSGRTMWVCAPTPELLDRFKIAIQDAINASVARDPADNMTFGSRKKGCIIQ